MEIAYIRAKSYMEHTSVNMATRLQNGDNPLNLILQGENVYTVNALMRALSVTDYQRISNELATVQSKLDMLVQAVEDYGLVIECDDDGRIILSNEKCQETRNDTP
jgi:uncharacterized protein YpuA (DUF1002 family)